MAVSPIHPSPWITWKGQPLPRITCSVWGPATICDGSRSLVGPVVLDTGSPPCMRQPRADGPHDPVTKTETSCRGFILLYILLVDIRSPLYSIVKSKLFGFNPNFGGFDPQIRCLNVLSWSSETLSCSLFAQIFIRNPGIPSYWEPGSLPLLWMVAKSCATWDGRKPRNNGINHLLTGARFRNHSTVVPIHSSSHRIAPIVSTRHVGFPTPKGGPPAPACWVRQVAAVGHGTRRRSTKSPPPEIDGSVQVEDYHTIVF